MAATRPVGRRRTSDGEGPSLSTLAKSLTILDALALAPPSEGRSHAELAAELGLRRSTLYRYLASMESQGLVEPIGDSRYRLGPRILALAAAAADERSFVSDAKEFVNALAVATGETAHATIYDNGEVVTVEIADGQGPVGPRIFLGSRRPAHCTASGKVFLAHLPEPILDSYVARGLPQRTKKTIADGASLKRALERVRALGYGIEQGEYADGISCVAAPIFDARSHVVGSLSISIVAKRLDQPRLASLIKSLTPAATAFSARLGFTEPAMSPAAKRQTGSTASRSGQRPRR